MNQLKIPQFGGRRGVVMIQFPRALFQQDTGESTTHMGVCGSRLSISVRPCVILKYVRPRASGGCILIDMFLQTR